MGNIFTKQRFVKCRSDKDLSPLLDLHMIMLEKLQEPGEMVILGTSTKGGDQSRFAKNVQQYAKEGV